MCGGRGGDGQTVEVQVVDGGGRIPGATLCLFESEDDRREDLEHCAISDADGIVRFDLSRPGTYVFRARLDGFLTTTIGPFELRAEDLRRWPGPQPRGCAADFCWVVTLNPNWPRVLRVTVP